MAAPFAPIMAAIGSCSTITLVEIGVKISNSAFYATTVQLTYLVLPLHLLIG